MVIGLYLIVCYFGLKNVCCIDALVTLESDYRTILKVYPIVQILESELDVPILKIDRFAVTPVRLMGADYIHNIARKVIDLCLAIILRLSWDNCEIIVRHAFNKSKYMSFVQYLGLTCVLISYDDRKSRN